MNITTQVIDKVAFCKLHKEAINETLEELEKEDSFNTLIVDDWDAIMPHFTKL